MFSNKHIIIALLVAPLLSLTAYFSVDYFVSERPERASVGEQYRLIASSSCRYSSGQCELSNGNLTFLVTAFRQEDDNLIVELQSNFSLDGVRLSIVDSPSISSSPKSMSSASGDQRNWSISLAVVDSEQYWLRLVASGKGSMYYAETGMDFMNYETVFNKELSR